jgi:hypothetical protein
LASGTASPSSSSSMGPIGPDTTSGPIRGDGAEDGTGSKVLPTALGAAASSATPITVGYADDSTTNEAIPLPSTGQSFGLTDRAIAEMMEGLPRRVRRAILERLTRGTIPHDHRPAAHHHRQR